VIPDGNLQDFLTRSLEFVFTHCWAWGEALIEQRMNGHKNRSDPTAEPPTTRAAELPRPAVLGILLAISLSHLLNDTIQALLPSIYPLLKQSYRLDFGQIGLITLTFQMTASILQPVVGYFTDRRPLPFSLAYGMGCTLLGLVILSRAGSFAMILIAAGVIGLGSSVFHPEASRVARLASGGRHGFAQSLFQVGGNAGTSLGPLLAAAVVVPYGQASVLWFAIIALAGMAILVRVGKWYRRTLAERRARPAAGAGAGAVQSGMSRLRVLSALAVLLALIFSKYFYLACLTNYYTFYQMERFHITVAQAQFSLFVFLFAVAAGTIIGGPVGDRIGRKRVIWASIAGVAPFTLALPYVSLPWMIVLSVFIGAILASAFSAILVYAQELLPGRVGLISGLFFGLAFGMAGIGSAVLGELADRTSIEFVFKVCAYLPLIGLLAAFLPGERKSIHGDGFK
jgi:FSR family fosmidomycin resistance protein-like MFS transporter